MSANKDMKRLVKRVEAAGGSYRLRKSGHACIVVPDGRKYFCSATPSDRRAIQNILSDLKRYFDFEV